MSSNMWDLEEKKTLLNINCFNLRERTSINVAELTNFRKNECNTFFRAVPDNLDSGRQMYLIIT